VAADDLMGLALGQQFDLITAAAVNGMFATENLPSLGGGLAFEVLYEPTRVTLQVINLAALPGDYNQDGTVNAADYTVWRNNLGSPTALPNDDSPGVGPDDYSRWKTLFGESSGSGAGTTGSANFAVPEPTAAVMLVFGLPLLLRRLNRVQKRGS
jgi:hypothetical protein